MLNTVCWLISFFTTSLPPSRFIMLHYSVNMNGEVKEGSLEIDSDNNLEQFKPGSRAEESVEIRNFQIASEFVLVFSFSGDFVCSVKKEGSKGKHEISVIWCRE